MSIEKISILGWQREGWRFHLDSMPLRVKQQIPPLRYASVAMTIHLRYEPLMGRADPATTQNQSATLTFVIPSAAQGSAVTFPGNRCPLRFIAQIICHPDRSVAQWRDLLFLAVWQQTHMEAPPYPLSSRAKPRDLQLLSPGNRCPLKFIAQIICHPDRIIAQWSDCAVDRRCFSAGDRPARELVRSTR